MEKLGGKSVKGLEKKARFGAEVRILDEVADFFRKFVSGMIWRCTKHRPYF